MERVRTSRTHEPSARRLDGAPHEPLPTHHHADGADEGSFFEAASVGGEARPRERTVADPSVVFR